MDETLLQPSASASASADAGVETLALDSSVGNSDGLGGDRNPSSSSDSDSDEEGSEGIEAETLEAQLTENPLNYEANVKYIRCLRKLGDIEKLRQARESMNEKFPLNPNMFSSSVNLKKKGGKNSLQKERVRLEENHRPPPPLLPPYIPENVIFSRILPLVSFDNLAKLKPVCKSWCNFISSNPMLPFDRFPVSSSSSSLSNYYSGVIFPECNSNGQLVFLPTSRGDVDVPDFLSVSFSHQQPLSCKELVASSGGLLCLDCNGNDDIVYVCNPLTKEGHVVPLSSNSSWHGDNVYVWHCSSIGLAYDSFKSPARYELVRPWSQFFEEGEEGRLVFGFEIFSSQTNQWDKSYNKYYAEEMVGCDYLANIFDRQDHHIPTMKSTYAGGVLYWDCCFFLIYFHPEKGYADTLPLPFHGYHDETEAYQIEEFKGHVTCSKVSLPRGMQLWIMDVNRSTEWELMYQVSFETVIQRTNRYDFRTADDMPLRNRKDLGIMFKGIYGVIPLPYGGDNGRRLFMRVPFVRENQDNVFCYDLNSGKLNKFCTLLPATYYYLVFNRHSFLYTSSMVSLPKLGKPSNHK